MLSSGQIALDSNRNQLFRLPADGTSARLRGLYTIIADETYHEITPSRSSTRLRHAHPITGNSVPHLIPPFRDRRLNRPQPRWYVDSAGNCAPASARATLAGSSHQSFARRAGLPHSWKAPDQLS